MESSVSDDIVLDNNELLPGGTLLKCDGQDITHKGKGRDKRKRIMVILPSQLALKKGAEGQLGYLDNANTDNPSLIIETGVILLTS